MSEKLLLALDFGGTKHSAAVTGQGERRWRALDRHFVSPGADATYDIEAVTELARSLLAGERPAAIGVSFGGPVNADRGEVRLSHHVPGWENVPLAALLSEAFDAPVAVDNDANVGAVGEYTYGAGQGVDSLLYVTVSTGVGGGWIVGGRRWQGSDGMAGEIGHIVVDPNGPLCLCGKRGCIERLASGPYMAQDARQLLRAEPERGRRLRELAADDLEAITGQSLAEAASQGDDVALAILQRGARALGLGLGNAANLINPDRFILGGGVTKAGDAWWQSLRQAARETALPEVHVEIVPAQLGDDAPLWGAVALAIAEL